MLSFLPLTNNTLNIGLNLLLPNLLLPSAIYKQTLLRLFFSLLDYGLQNCHRHHQLLVNNQ